MDLLKSYYPLSSGTSSTIPIVIPPNPIDITIRCVPDFIPMKIPMFDETGVMPLGRRWPTALRLSG